MPILAALAIGDDGRVRGRMIMMIAVKYDDDHQWPMTILTSLAQHDANDCQ